MTELHRCAARTHCRNTEQVDDATTGKTIRQGAQINEPYGLCDTCTTAVSHALSDMTETWLSLHMAIGDHTARPGQRVSTTRSAPINLNADVDALKTSITEWLVAAAARVAELLNCDDPQPANNTDLEHARVVLACTRLLAPNVDKLLSLPADCINVWLGHGETERPGEYWKDEWGVAHGRREVDMTGVDLAIKLMDLRSKARKLLGLTNTEKLVHPCPYCNQMSLKRNQILVYSSGSRKLDDEETERAQCGNCGLDWPYKRYEALCLMWLKEDEMERDRLQQELETAQRERDILSWLLSEREYQFSLALACTDIPASVFAKEVLTCTVYDTDALMSDRDLAPIVGVAESTIRSWASKGLISKHVSDDGSMVFLAGEVWEQAKTVGRRTTASA